MFYLSKYLKNLIHKSIYKEKNKFVAKINIFKS